MVSSLWWNHAWFFLQLRGEGRESEKAYGMGFKKWISWYAQKMSITNAFQWAVNSAPYSGQSKGKGESRLLLPTGISEGSLVDLDISSEQGTGRLGFTRERWGQLYTGQSTPGSHRGGAQRAACQASHCRAAAAQGRKPWGSWKGDSTPRDLIPEKIRIEAFTRPSRNANLALPWA